MNQPQFDLAIIGGGIVGLALGYEALRTKKSRSVVVIEKEPTIFAHQSGHNSGVLHSGLYYAPGSAKAKNCLRGKERLEQLCREERLPFEICGKIVVATAEAELPRLENLKNRALANGVSCQTLSADEIRQFEPHVRGLCGLHVPGTGIVSFPAVGEFFATTIRSLGQQVLLSSTVLAIREEQGLMVLETTRGTISARQIVNCAGLYCDKVAGLMAKPAPVQIVPFRGEYYKLLPEYRSLCRNLIYPVPDPAFPFLGVHFTRMISGEVECGPNAVLAFAREGYTNTSIHPAELLETLTYPGFQRFARKHWKMGMMELWRSFSKAAFVRSLQRLIPKIEGKMLVPAPAGIRAQALKPDGSLVDDFLIERRGQMVNVLNAPSPAATSCLGIAETVIAAL